MGNPLRVLQVCSASEHIYGAAISLVTLAEAQRRAGHTVEFLTFQGKPFGEEVRRRGFGDHEVRVRTKIDLPAIFKMRRVMREGRFDVVHTHLSTSSVNGGLAARFARVPSVATVHGMSSKFSFLTVDRLIAVSEGVKHHLVGQGMSSDRIEVVYNGVEVGEPADRLRSRASLDLGSEVLVIGTVARVTPLKGIEDALRALPRIVQAHPDVLYLVVGDGGGLPACRALAESLEVTTHVRFVGYQKDIAAYLGAMDLFVLPTHKEAMGVSLVEAMAQGLACVATRVGGIPEVVPESCGILVPVQSPEALADAVTELLSDRNRREGMGQVGRRRVEALFTTDAMQSGTAAVYRKLIEFRQMS